MSVNVNWGIIIGVIDALGPWIIFNLHLEGDSLTSTLGIGTEIFRHDINKIIPGIKNNFWVNSLKIKCLNYKKSNPNIKLVIADLRFQNEVDMIHELGGKVIKVNRPNMNIVDEHESETKIDEILDFDHLIINDGTIEELYEKIGTLYKNLS